MGRTGYLALAGAGVLYGGRRLIQRFGFDERLIGVALEPVALTGLSMAAVLLALYAGYDIVGQYLLKRTESKRRQHDVRNLLRLVFGTLALVASFGVITR
ncbi:MAG: hypothetical protein U5K28_02570 [Halobacteriales archaeon]|nr:hypothetical protein [Halobacteriales archaeon]